MEARREETITSIAVLTPEDLSPDRTQGYFCEGLANELVNDLSKIRNMRVASRVSSSLVHQATTDVREIGSELNVQAIVRGSVRREGERLRITAELFEVATGFLLWSERTTPPARRRLLDQDEIAGKIVEALNMKLTIVERRSIRPPDIRRPGVRLLPARAPSSTSTAEGSELALQMFKMATRHGDLCPRLPASPTVTASSTSTPTAARRAWTRRIGRPRRPRLDSTAEAHISSRQVPAGRHQRRRRSSRRRRFSARASRRTTSPHCFAQGLERRRTRACGSVAED
jgi:TolB-like protein